MSIQPGFTWPDEPCMRSQKAINDYYYETAEAINQYCKERSETEGERRRLINKLERDIGRPKKLNILQKLFT